MPLAHDTTPPDSRLADARRAFRAAPGSGPAEHGRRERITPPRGRSAVTRIVVNVWSRPARNDFCNATFPTCDPASTPIYQVAHGQMVTTVCVVSNGQRIITGTAANPGYDDRRWIALTTGGYLTNTWWARTWISANLRVC